MQGLSHAWGNPSDTACVFHFSQTQLQSGALPSWTLSKLQRKRCKLCKLYIINLLVWRLHRTIYFWLWLSFFFRDWSTEKKKHNTKMKGCTWFLYEPDSYPAILLSPANAKALWSPVNACWMTLPQSTDLESVLNSYSKVWKKAFFPPINWLKGCFLCSKLHC